MTNRRAPNGQTHVETLPPFLVTLTRNIKSREIFKLNSLNHIIIKVESYRTHTGLMQCYNCQNFGHVWANCKQPPRCLWCSGGHLHRECPEKMNTESKLICCNCTVVDRGKPHPASYWGCSHTKGELQRRRAQWTPKGSSGRTLFSKFTSPQHSYADALHQDKQQQQPQATQTEQQYLPQMEFQKRGLSIQAPDRAQWNCVRRRQSNGYYKIGT
jgi:hypothetical protein